MGRRPNNLPGPETGMLRDYTESLASIPSWSTAYSSLS